MLLTKTGDTDNSYMYVGEEYNANTGLYYLRARYMNPSTGSFTTMDSYQGSLYEPISLHKYAYANANPVSNIDPSGYFATSISECAIVQAVQKGIKDIVQIQALRKVMSWANVACTTYDICVALREMFLNDADSFAIFHSILRGMIIDQLVDCLLSGPVKIVAKAIMICKELGDQVDTIKYDLEQGDYISAGIHAIQLLVIIFSIMAQCFTGETEVMTDEGLVAIEDIEVGDYVLAEDTVTGEQEYKEVLNVFVSQTNKLVHVTTADDNSETTINTTDNHPFYVEGKGWVPAIELEAGDQLRTADGEIETVSRVEVEYLDEAVLIYNLEVEGYHTYFVSDESVLVHNSYESGDGGNGNSEGGSETVPNSLLQGDSNTRVYLGIIDGEPDYVGIAYDVERRQSQHGDRFDYLREITTEPLTRRQARAIEQAMIKNHPEYSNKINSISTKRDWYYDAVTWGEAWLREHGLLE